MWRRIAQPDEFLTRTCESLLIIAAPSNDCELRCVAIQPCASRQMLAASASGSRPQPPSQLEEGEIPLNDEGAKVGSDALKTDRPCWGNSHILLIFCCLRQNRRKTYILNLRGASMAVYICVTLQSSYHQESTTFSLTRSPFRASYPQGSGDNPDGLMARFRGDTFGSGEEGKSDAVSLPHPRMPSAPNVALLGASSRAGPAAPIAAGAWGVSCPWGGSPELSAGGGVHGLQHSVRRTEVLEAAELCLRSLMLCVPFERRRATD